jgi:hypothetical protein
MVQINTDHPVPSSADERLDELAEILACAIHRMVTEKSVSHSKTRLDFYFKTRLNVTSTDTPKHCEVTS